MSSRAPINLLRTPWAVFAALLVTLALVGGCRRSPAAELGATSAATLNSPGSPSAKATAPGARGPASSASRSTPSGTGKSFLWKLQSASATVHLLGSIHVGRPDVYPLAPAIDTAFERSSTLVLEIQLDDGARSEASAQLIAAGSYPAGDSLDKHVPAPLIERLRARATPPLPPVEALFRFEPWFVSQLLMMTELTKLGFAEDNGIDRHFQRRAQGKKRIEALETIEDQVALLDRLPPDIQVLMLSESLDELGELGPMLERAFEAWKRGDGQALYDLLMKSLDEPRYAPLKKRLFSDRNVRMAAAIQERLRKHGSWFVIVGSGHLIGPDGILALLEAQGARAEQL